MDRREALQLIATTPLALVAGPAEPRHPLRLRLLVHRGLPDAALVVITAGRPAKPLMCELTGPGRGVARFFGGPPVPLAYSGSAVVPGHAAGGLVPHRLGVAAGPHHLLAACRAADLPGLFALCLPGLPPPPAFAPGPASLWERAAGYGPVEPWREVVRFGAYAEDGVAVTWAAAATMATRIHA